MSTKGRHARFNEDPVAEVRSIPSPASSTSSLAPSPGPSTPPPFPDVAYSPPTHSPAHASVSPYQSPSQPHVYTSPVSHPHGLPFIPAPLAPSVYTHVGLAAPNLQYDMRYHHTQLKLQLSLTALTEPASNPPLQTLSLRIAGLPWLVVVRPDSRLSPGNAIVTVQDVLSTIYFNLRTVVKPDEYNAMDKSSKAALYQAFERRVGADPAQRGKGLRRIDFLCGHVVAQGLVRAQSKDNIWDVVVR
ncbi:hypothetical protein BJV78DRAFT_1286029 [Lactifluus subvellereus]|nr:hypothetical protein BJV78DRAFT_1286029 [Lactifluus subvellereus]